MYHQDVSESGSSLQSGNFPVIVIYTLLFILSVIRLIEIFSVLIFLKDNSDWISTSMPGTISCFITAKIFLTRRFA